ncbi:MAG: HEAT repeat domain-containing protein [Proteobacteria bacterium]|nr:HEAT repeat domain-containing protein [Pseudomonadota bacterium]
MKRAIRLLMLVLCLGAGCAGVDAPDLTLPEVASPQRVDREITLLPIVDSRRFVSPGQQPDLNQPLPLMVSADAVLDQGRTIMLREGLFRSIRTYYGPLPEDLLMHYADFPLRTLDTDLALGLELRDLEVRKVGKNAHLVPQSLLDATLLPLFTLGAFASGGRMDLAAQIIPSGILKYIVRLDLHVFSLEGGGPVWGKTYLVHIQDPAVTDWTLRRKWEASAREESDLKDPDAEKAVIQAFQWICRDPEMAYLPRFSRTAWLARIMADPRVSARTKADLLDGFFTDLPLPDMSPGDMEIWSTTSASVREKSEYALGQDQEQTAVHLPEAAFLNSYTVDPVWIQEAGARLRLFKAGFGVLLETAGQLGRKGMECPLDESERALEARLETLLGRWGRGYAPNRVYRQAIRNPNVGIEEKQFLFRLLAGDLETLDNETFVNQELERRLEQLNDGPKKLHQRAAALLVAAWGDKSLDNRGIPPKTLLSVMGSGDDWAGPWVLSLIKAGDLSPDVIRLAGALRLDEALPILIQALQPTAYSTGEISEAAIEPEIPMLGAELARRRARRAPDRVLVARALGCFKGRPEAVAALRSMLEGAGPQTGLPTDLSAQVVRSLARLRDIASLPVLMALWDAPGIFGQEAALLRRAVLDALEPLGSPEVWERVLATASVQARHAKTRQAPLREIADFFGRVRFERAASFLKGLAVDPASSSTTREAACQALARIATPSAEQALTEMAAAARWDLARNAQAALEKLARERALWKGL